MFFLFKTNPAYIVKLVLSSKTNDQAQHTTWHVQPCNWCQPLRLGVAEHKMPPGMITGWGVKSSVSCLEKNSNCNPEKHTQNTRCKQNNHFLIFLKFSGRLTLIKSGTPNSRTLIRRNFWGLYLLESEPDWDSQVLQSESEWDSQVPRGALLSWTGTKFFLVRFFYLFGEFMIWIHWFLRSKWLNYWPNLPTKHFRI